MIIPIFEPGETVIRPGEPAKVMTVTGIRIDKGGVQYCCAFQVDPRTTHHENYRQEELVKAPEATDVDKPPEK